MAGYSGTPLSKKLGIKPGSRRRSVRAPAGFERAPRPVARTAFGCARKRAPRQDVVLFFATRIAELERRFDGLAHAVAPTGGLWIAWPKRTSNVATDLREGVVREIGLAHGLVDNKVCAVDDMWSGLRFVYRVKDRPSTQRPRLDAR